MGRFNSDVASDITLYSRAWCSWCTDAKESDIDFSELVATLGAARVDQELETLREILRGKAVCLPEAPVKKIPFLGRKSFSLGKAPAPYMKLAASYIKHPAIGQDHRAICPDQPTIGPNLRAIG